MASAEPVPLPRKKVHTYSIDSERPTGRRVGPEPTPRTLPLMGKDRPSCVWSLKTGMPQNETSRNGKKKMPQNEASETRKGYDNG